jgi:dynein heavy chain
MRPGMVTLTWTSMNIDSYIQHVQLGLKHLRELICSINDIIKNRIEKNLKDVSKTLLIDLPDDSSFTVANFVQMQQNYISTKATELQGKNNEIENAVEDLIAKICAYRFEMQQEHVTQSDMDKLRQHYNHFMYQALLHSAKNSMNALKKRIGSRGGTTILNSSKPFFNVDVQLMPPNVSLSPSLDEIQACINSTAKAVLICYKSVLEWGESGDGEPRTFFERITKDIELVRVALLLTGCVQGIRNTVTQYLQTFVKVCVLVECRLRTFFVSMKKTLISMTFIPYSMIGCGNLKRMRNITSLH